MRAASIEAASGGRNIGCDKFQATAAFGNGLVARQSTCASIRSQKLDPSYHAGVASSQSPLPTDLLPMPPVLKLSFDHRLKLRSGHTRGVLPQRSVIVGRGCWQSLETLVPSLPRSRRHTRRRQPEPQQQRPATAFAEPLPQVVWGGARLVTYFCFPALGGFERLGTKTARLLISGE